MEAGLRGFRFHSSTVYLLLVVDGKGFGCAATARRGSLGGDPLLTGVPRRFTRLADVLGGGEGERFRVCDFRDDSSELRQFIQLGEAFA